MAWVDAACGGSSTRSRRARSSRPMSTLFRVAQMLGDYAVHGAVLRRYSRSVSKLAGSGCRGDRPVPGVASGRRPRRLDGAGVWDAGRGVRRVRGHPRRAGPLRRRRGRGVRRHADRIPGQDRRAEAVRGAVVPQVRVRRRPGRRRRTGRGPGGALQQAGQDPIGVGSGRRGPDPGRGRPGQPVREAGLRDHLAGHQARAARRRRQTAGVRRLRLAGQPAERGAGQDRPPGAAAVAERGRLGGDRLHSPWSAGLRLPAGVPAAHRPDRPVLRPGPSASDPGQARPGGSRARSARNAATACIRCGTRWRPG